MSTFSRGRLLTGFVLGVSAACSVYDETLLISRRGSTSGGSGGTSHGAAGDAPGGEGGFGGAGPMTGGQGADGGEPTGGRGGMAGATTGGTTPSGGSSGSGGAPPTGGKATTGGTSEGGAPTAGAGGEGGVGGADTCGDGVVNGSETAKDCGGGCPACATGQACAVDGDCQSKHCISKACMVIDCTDKVRNGRETDADCGGPDCPPCAYNKMCTAHSDCVTGDCASTLCAYPKGCKELKTLSPMFADGQYTVDPDGPSGANAAFAVYCDMTTASGGWTRVGYEPSGAGGSKINGALRNLGVAVGTPANVAGKTAAGLIGSRFNGLYTELRISWGADYAQMTVSADIFADTAQVALPVSKVTSSNTTLMGWLSSAAVFCRASTSSFRPGDTSWALVPSNNPNTTCGCSGMGWTGNGIYYGGANPADSCGAWGGAFSGVRAVGETKGGITSTTELVLWVR